MAFKSFEQVLEICLNGEEQFPEQKAALRYCLENAAPAQQDTFQESFTASHDHDCGCGC